MRIGLSVRITLYSVRWNARSVKFEIHFQPSGTVQVQHQKPSVRCRVSPVDRLSIGFQAVKSIQISTISGPSETALPDPADEPAPRRAQDVPGAAPEHLIPRAATPEAVSFRCRFFVKTGLCAGSPTTCLGRGSSRKKCEFRADCELVSLSGPPGGDTGAIVTFFTHPHPPA